MRALARSKNHKYSFFGGHNDFQGIKAFTGDQNVSVEKINFTGNEKTGKMAISGYEPAVSSEFDATIIIGNPNIHATWSAQKLAHSNGLKVAYWAHGWIRKESWLKSHIRNYYFNKADRVLVYSSRAIDIAKSTGFDENNISVIYNSLDWDLQSTYYEKMRGIPRDDLRQDLEIPPAAVVLLTISRVTAACRYDWLLDAAHMIGTGGRPLCVVMIGDGPELSTLKERIKELDIDVRLVGALYDEARIAAYVMAADAVVSPGKVGLTAMHALAYGTPVITHGDLDLQMPEIEAIEEGKSGSLFKYGSINDLAGSISKVISWKKSREQIRESCRDSLIGRFTPTDQCKLIDAAVDRMLR